MATLENVAQQAQGMKYQQSINDTRTMSGLQSLAPQYQQQTVGKTDTLAKDLNSIISKGWEAVEQDMELTDKATQLLANDMLSQQKIRTNEIDAMEISTEEKRARYLALNAELNNKAANTIDLDNERQKMVFDQSYTNKAKEFNAKTLSSYDKQMTTENIVKVRQNAQTFLGTVSVGKSGVSLDEYKSMNEYAIRLGGITEKEVEVEWLNSGISMMSNKREDNNNEFMATYKNKDDLIYDTIGIDTYNSLGINERNSLDKNIEKIFDSARVERKEYSNEFSDDIISQSFDADMTQLKSLESQVLLNKDKLDTGVSNKTIKYLRVLQRSKQKDIADLKKEEQTELKNILKSTIKVNKDATTVNYDNVESFGGIDKEGNFSQSPQKESMFHNTLSAIATVYSDNTVEAGYQANKFIEQYDKSMSIATEVAMQEIEKPNSSFINSETKDIVNKKRERTIFKHYEGGDYARASKYIAANNALPKDIVSDLRGKIVSGNIDDITGAVKTLGGLSINGTTKSLIMNNKDLKHIYTYAQIASRNKLTEKEVATIEKINDGTLNVTDNFKRARNIVSKLGIDETSKEYSTLVNEANYLLAMEINDGDAETMIEELKANSMYRTDSNDVSVHYPPDWASGEVIDTMADMFTNVLPQLKEGNISVEGGENDTIVIYQGAIDQSKIIGIFNKDDYINILAEYRDDGKDEAYNEYSERQDRLTKHRNKVTGTRLITQLRRDGELTKEAFEKINKKWFNGEEKYVGDY